MGTSKKLLLQLQHEPSLSFDWHALRRVQLPPRWVVVVWEAMQRPLLLTVRRSAAVSAIHCPRRFCTLL